LSRVTTRPTTWSADDAYGGFLARKSDGEPGWQTIWKGWFVLMILVEGYELAQAITFPK
jgi:hypothetical protein